MTTLIEKSRARIAKVRSENLARQATQRKAEAAKIRSLRERPMTEREISAVRSSLWAVATNTQRLYLVCLWIDLDGYTPETEAYIRRYYHIDEEGRRLR